MDLINLGIDKKYIIAILALGSIFSTQILQQGINYIANKLMKNDDQQNNQGQHKKPAGIYNSGNTCFVNSLLQALASVEKLRENINETLKMKDLKNEDQFILQELNSVMQRINNNNEQGSIDVTNFLNIIQEHTQNLINFQQQDAHQLYSVIIHAFDNVFNNQKIINLSRSALTQSTTEVQNQLKGYLKSSITCIKCHTQTNIKLDAFYDLSLDINRMDIRSLQDATKYFERQQYIEHWTCSQCSIIKHISKLQKLNEQFNGENKIILKLICQDFLHYLKNSHIVQLDIKEINANFSSYVMKYSKQFQSLQKDQFRNQLFVDLQSVTSTIKKQTQIIKYPKILVIHFKQLIIHPMTGMPVYLKRFIDFQSQFKLPLRNGQRIYHLTSLLTHIGNQAFGHYFTFRKVNKRQNKWFVLSDTTCQPCKWETLKRHIPYMLFYQAQ